MSNFCPLSSTHVSATPKSARSPTSSCSTRRTSTGPPSTSICPSPSSETPTNTSSSAHNPRPARKSQIRIPKPETSPNHRISNVPNSSASLVVILSGAKRSRKIWPSNGTHPPRPQTAESSVWNIPVLALRICLAFRTSKFVLPGPAGRRVTNPASQALTPRPQSAIITPGLADPKTTP